MSARRTWTLLGREGARFESPVRGKFGGHRRTKIYGRLDCPAALRAILLRKNAGGGYVANRVFFLDEPTARAAGYRPCAVCMPEQYRRWKASAQSIKRRREK